jgi:hypothetical protein
MNQEITDILLDELELPEVTVEELEPREAPEGVDPGLWKQWEDEEQVKQDKFLWSLKRGQKGLNVGFDNGRTTINKYLHGTHRARYTLIGAESGAGKTTIGDFMYVLKLWESAKKMNRKCKIIYLSYEIGWTEKVYRWCSYFIFYKHGIRLPADYLQGQIHGCTPSDMHTKMALEAYSTIKGILDRKEIVIIEETYHPTMIFNGIIEDTFAKYGEVLRSSVTAEEARKGKQGYIIGYTEAEEVMVELVVDHLALTGTEKGLDTKGTMDKLSRYAIVLRNIFHCSCLFMQQFSTDMMGAYRNNYGKKDAGAIRPTRLDFGDSKATYRDADVVLGYVKPQNEMDNFYGYSLKKPSEGGLGQYFVAEYLMKNRYGPSGRLIPLFVDYVTGFCTDLPLDPSDVAMQPFYDEARKIEEICQTFSPKLP